MAERDGDDPGARGRLTIADQALERVAVLAAGEVDGVVRTGSALEGVIGRRFPKADADVAGDRARVSVELAVAWPAVLPEVAGRVRELVRERLGATSGFRVDAVHVSVVKVVRPQAPERRRVQ